jgi:hypothetical protein
MVYRMQFFRNFSQIASGTPFPFGKLQKGLKQLFELLQKVIGYPLVLFARGIRELHAAPIMLAIYR